MAKRNVGAGKVWMLSISDNHSSIGFHIESFSSRTVLYNKAFWLIDTLWLFCLLFK